MLMTSSNFMHQPLVVRCLRWCRHNYHHCVCVQSDSEQVGVVLLAVL